MSVSVTLNGLTYSLPSTDETSWGTNVTGFLQSLASGTLQKSGGAFTLTADANFGGTYGLVAQYFTSRTALPATAGQVRLANVDTIKWRNAANSAHLTLGTDATDNLEFEGVDVVTVSGTQTLTNKTVTNLKDNTRAYARATRGTSQAIPNTGDNIVDFATVELDSRSGITTGASWKYTVQSGHDGLYLVSGQANLDAIASAGQGVLKLYKNGTVYARLDRVAASAVTFHTSGSTIISLVAGDYIDLRLFQDSSTGNRNTGGAAESCHISIIRLVSDL